MKLDTKWMAVYLLAVLIGIAGWWVNKVNNSMDVTQQLQFRSLYMNGNMTAAPLQPIPKN